MATILTDDLKLFVKYYKASIQKYLLFKFYNLLKEQITVDFSKALTKQK